MGEVVVSSGDLGVKMLEGEADIEEREKAEEGSVVAKKGGESSGLMIMWEKFLQRRMLRVLLVEADDSTRQIIAALLRKCSYRVAAVSDGLKAWDILKGRPHNIDFILTEVELPAISGYALLTLIMEHEICKNIPVIMMSSHDSISTVYNCMLRGAADYLVKPIRKNELRNLWQHVWRRQTSLAGLKGPQYESVAQQKVEATAENDAASNHSSGEDKQFIEKGNEAQSSCTKPDVEVEIAPIKDFEEFTQTKCNTQYVSENNVVENEVCINLGWKEIMPSRQAVGLAIAICKNSESGVGRAFDLGYHKSKADNLDEACGNKATDLNAAFPTYPNCNVKNLPSSSGTEKNDTYPKLDLSLRRPQSHLVENKVIEERNTIIHSNASAFRRYSQRQMQTSPTAKQQIECGAYFEKNVSDMVTGCHSETSAPSLGRSFSPVTAQLKESDIATSQLQQRAHPIPVPVGTRYNNLCQAYGSLRTMFCTQSNPQPVPSPSSADHPEHSLPANMFYHSNIEDHNSSKLYRTHGQYARNDNDPSMQKQDQRLESIEDQGRVSTATEQSACSGVRDSTLSHLDSIGYGSNFGSSSKVDQVPAVVEGSESKTEDLTNLGFSQQSVLREAALIKFRMKRKERCYGKKVRYESRKKLAEQRPRVKGQFVRQGHSNVQPTENNGDKMIG